MKKQISTFAGLLSVAFTLSVAAWSPSAHAQTIDSHGGFTTTASNVVVPQSRSYVVVPRAETIQITGVAADIRILQQVATTTLSVKLANNSDRQQEAEMLIPVPEGAVVRTFAFAGSKKELTARLLPKAEARSTYDAIVSKVRDPALLEFAGYSLVRSSVFPVPARGGQEVRLVYEQVLTADGNRVDYVLPRSESFESGATPWNISVRVRSKTPVSTLYSPSHQIATERAAPEEVSARVQGEPRVEPGPFRLSYLVEGDGVSASLLAYPDERVGGGYFLLLAGVPASADTAQRAAAIKREVTLVIDRSGSMEGEKIEQARAAALQVVEGLKEGEYFNIIDYSETVEKFAEGPVAKNAKTLADARGYIKRLRAGGGTNIRDALVVALRQNATTGALPLVLFLTDGLPTVGETREVMIRKSVTETNPHRRRVFTFGVGYDVNAPLLNSIANATRASSTFVFPKENVEAKVSQVFRKLSGPVLSDPQLAVLDSAGQVTTRAVRELLPTELSDLFEGDQLVLLGQYSDAGPLTFRLEGNYLGAPRTFRFAFDLKNATTRNSFVPRLWASRKITRLIEEITEAGAEQAAATPATVMIQTAGGRSVLAASGNGNGHAGGVAPDPRLKELVDEIVRLSTEYGILTEYTSFLATEGTDFSRRDQLNEEARQNLIGNAQQTRSGMGGVSQAVNSNTQRVQSNLNRSNFFLTQNMQRVEITTVQQITDRTFFRRGERWVDARALDKESTTKPDEVIEFGTPAFKALVDKLVAEGRQGLLALSGEMLLVVDGKTILIKPPTK